MPQVWKISRYQQRIFLQDQNWRKPLHGILSILWALLWGAIAFWILAGGPEARQLLGSLFRGVSQFFRELLSGLSWLLN